jgi:hypothetical protein
MTIKEVIFFFQKEPNSLDLHFVEARKDSANFPVFPDRADKAVSEIFKKLIARDPSRYKSPLFSLSDFSLTLLTRPLSKNYGLEIETENVFIQLTTLKQETADSLLNSFDRSSNSKVATKTSEEEAQSRTKKLEPDVKEFNLQPDSLLPPRKNLDDFEDLDSSSQPGDPLSLVKTSIPAPRIETTSSSLPSLPVRQLTKEEEMYIAIESLMNAQFFETQIRLSPQDEMLFGTYLMQRVFGKPVSCHFDFETHAFTLNFVEEKRIHLTNLPQHKFPQELEELKQILNSTLYIPKKLKGKFNIDEHKLTFEPGSLKLEWRWTSAQLLGIYENGDNTVTMQITYLKNYREEVVSAQDFIDLLECNMLK